MSAFVCSEKTINNIVAFLADKNAQDRIGAVYSSPITKLGYYVHFGNGFREDEERRREYCKRLAMDLFAMNVDAVNARYREDNESDGFEYKAVVPPSPVGALKAMSCLRYQCSEGDVPKEPLYCALNECIHLLAEHIVVNSKEYDESANWH